MSPPRFTPEFKDEVVRLEIKMADYDHRKLIPLY